MKSQTGGRHCAKERGAFEIDSDIPPPPETPAGPLIERLSAQSLAEIAEFCNIPVAVLLEKYRC